MNFATLLRYVKLENNDVWDHRYYALNTYYIFAERYKVGMTAIYNEYDYEKICERCDGNCPVCRKCNFVIVGTEKQEIKRGYLVVTSDFEIPF